MIKYFYTLLIAVFTVLGSIATEVNFDFANNEFKLPTTTNTGDASKYITTPISKEGIIITPHKGSSTLGPLMYESTYNKTLDLRFYKGSAFEITSTSGSAITKIDFVSNGKLDVVADSGDWSGETYETWNGNSGRVSFAVNGSTQLYSITVTTEAGTATCAVPIFSHESGEWYEPLSIAISCATEGSIIRYTTNGETPTTDSQIYTAPIAVSVATTIKAIGMKESALSTVAEATYSFPEFATATNISDFIGMSSTALPIRLNGDVVVTYQNAKYMFVKDDSGEVQIYGEVGKFYNRGDIIPAGIVGTWNSYSGAIQLMPIAKTFQESTANTTINPREVMIVDFNAKLANSFVIGKNWNLHITKAGNNYTYKASDATGEMLDIYLRFKGVTAPTEEGKYDITGIANIFNETLQIYPIEFVKASGVNDVEFAKTTIKSGNGEIIINATKTTHATIYNASGVVVSTFEVTEGLNHISAKKGFYIVGVDSTTQKVVVR